MHGCYFITFREVRRLRMLDVFERTNEFAMHFKRAANARLCFRLYPLLNPVITYFPLFMACQLISDSAVPWLCLVFWIWPIAFAHWGEHSPSEAIFFRQYFYYWILFCLLYAAPLVAIVALGAGPNGLLSSLVGSTFQNGYWYMEAFVTNSLIGALRTLGGLALMRARLWQSHCAYRRLVPVPGCQDGQGRGRCAD